MLRVWAQHCSLQDKTHNGFLQTGKVLPTLSKLPFCLWGELHYAHIKRWNYLLYRYCFVEALFHNFLQIVWGVSHQALFLHRNHNISSLYMGSIVALLTHISKRLLRKLSFYRITSLSRYISYGKSRTGFIILGCRTQGFKDFHVIANQALHYLQPYIILEVCNFRPLTGNQLNIYNI